MTVAMAARAADDHGAAHMISEAKSRRALSVVIGAAVTLRKAGAELVGLCPFHDDTKPSLNVNDRKGLWTCRACGAGGDAITFVERYYKWSFAEAVAELASAPFEASAARFMRETKARADEYANRQSARWEPSEDERSRMRQAQEIGHAAILGAGTLAERYLRGRGIVGRLPEAIRFAPSLYYSPAGKDCPAMVALLRDSSGALIAIQRTFLDPVTGGKAEPAREAKRTLGPMHDGAVKLAKPGPILGVAEGIETALSAAQIFSVPVWAVLGNARFTAVHIPADVEQVVIFADNGKDGRVDPKAIEAAEEIEARGFAVAIEAPDGAKDWNDVLRGRP